MENQGWIGVDLDRTIAHYDKWRGADHVGEPIPLMVQRVKKWLAEGRDVRIFTARVSHDTTQERLTEAFAAKAAIEDWCERHIGQRLQITNAKDYAMVELWDDRAVQVVPNEGVAVQDLADTLHARLAMAEADRDALQSKLAEFDFGAGGMIAQVEYRDRRIAELQAERDALNDVYQQSLVQQDYIRAERDAARAEVESMRQEREDALTASGMNWQAYLDLSATSTVKQTQLSGEIGLGEQRIKELEEALLTAQSGEARAVEALKVGEELAREVCDALWAANNLFLTEEQELFDWVNAVEWVSEPQPALAWLAQQRAEAAAEALEQLAKDRDADTEGEEESFFRGIMTTEDCRERAAALRAGATGGVDA